MLSDRSKTERTPRSCSFQGPGFVITQLSSEADPCTVPAPWPEAESPVRLSRRLASPRTR